MLLVNKKDFRPHPKSKWDERYKEIFDGLFKCPNEDRYTMRMVCDRLLKFRLNLEKEGNTLRT